MSRSAPDRRPGVGVLVLSLAVGALGPLGLLGQGSTAAAAPAAPRVTTAASDKALAKRLAAVLADSRVRQATTAVSVVDAVTGRQVYGRTPTKAITPASNTKLITAAAALDTLGPSFRFRTEVVHRAPIRGGTLDGYLYLKGFGDPTTMASDYRSLARQVRAVGVRTVTGKLGVDTSYFDNQTYNPHWSKGYAGAYYAARIRPLTIAPNTDYDAGTVIIDYAPGAVGTKAEITVTPAAAAKVIKISNTSRTVRGSGSLRIDRAYGSNTITIRGTVKAGAKRGREWVTVDRPELVAAQVFRDELRKAGVTVKGSTRTMTIPSGLQKRIAVDRSMTLAELMVPFLKLSNNMHAEALTKTMGRIKGRGGSWAGGLSVTRDYLRSAKVPTTSLVLVDGSGLTRSNKISPRTMTTLLVRARTEPWSASFTRGLPVAGDARRMVGGTLTDRMRHTAASGNARAKTGSLTGVTALSGYVSDRDGRRYAFSMLSRYTRSTPRPVEDRLVVSLAGWRR